MWKNLINRMTCNKLFDPSSSNILQNNFYTKVEVCKKEKRHSRYVREEIIIKNPCNDLSEHFAENAKAKLKAKCAQQSLVMYATFWRNIAKRQ